MAAPEVAASPASDSPGGVKLLLSFEPFFRPYRRQIGAWFLIYGLYSLMGILTPLALRFYLDDILPVGRLNRIALFAAGYFVYALGLHVLYYFGIQGTVRLIESVVADLRAAVYEKLHRLTIRYFDKTLSGEIVNRVTNDTRQLLNLIGGELVNVTLQICAGLVALVVIFVSSVHLALIVVAFLPVYAWLFRRFLPLVHKAARSWRRSDDRLWGNWGEKLKGMAVIQAFTRERGEALKHHVFGHTASDQWYRMTMTGTTMNVLGGLAASFSNHTAFAFGCLLSLNGDLKLGALFSLTGVIGYIIAPVQGVFNLINTWKQSEVSAERIQTILNEVEEARLAEGRRRVGKLKGEIRFEHVTFEYERGRPVLFDVTFTIRAGQNVALVGHTGCGKTTLVNLLLDFYRPLEGAILVDGTPLGDVHPQDLRRNIGVVPQDVVLFSDSIRANVAYGRPDATDEELWRVLKVAQVDDYVKALPGGLETRLGGEGGVTPSEGEAQRLSIARAVLIDPAIVVLDEATSSLDSREEARLQVAVKELLAGRTAVIIAHRLSTIRACDLVVVMERGRVIELGNPAELLARPDSVYARLHRAHFAGGVIHG